jgi:hypothetical protein
MDKNCEECNLKVGEVYKKHKLRYSRCDSCNKLVCGLCVKHEDVDNIDYAYCFDCLVKMERGLIQFADVCIFCKMNEPDLKAENCPGCNKR